MTKPSTRFERAAAYILLLAAVVYLIPFVSRGWIPHDEGMTGHTAERVLRGEVPHVGYQEPYTGGLTLMYAWVFKVAGIDLLNLRWLLLAGASLAQLLTYAILRRRLRPVGAAVATWVALGWSFPNYFAGLPSWWVLLCALLSLWSILRYVETGRPPYAALAGIAAGMAVVVKQTGVYLLPPVMMSLWITSRPAENPIGSWRDSDRWLRVAFGVCALAGVGLLLKARIFGGELVYLLVPVAASCAAFVLPYRGVASTSVPARPAAVLVAGASAALPLLLFLLPYIADGQLKAFIEGAFISPQKRVVFAALQMPPALLVISGAVVAFGMLMVPRSWTADQNRWFDICRWIAAAALVAWSLRAMVVYQLLWQSARAMAALLPPTALWILATRRTTSEPERIMLFATASMLAWCSLVQFPYGLPVYFCYVAPLAVITGVAAAATDLPMPVRNPRPWLGLVLGFSLLSLNRGYVDTLGFSHIPRRLDVPLGLPRAHLGVSADDARTYQRTTELVNHYLRGGPFVAGPDCPELYFLTAQPSPAGTLFDFFAPDDEGAGALSDSRWLGASVVVINHSPGFSPLLRPDLIARLRQEFAGGEQVGRFEVRWR